MRLRQIRPLLTALLMTAAFGCAPDSDENEYEGRCQAPDGVNAAPGTILEALQLIDALPRPVTVACVLESLDRPMTLIGSTSPFSAQPAFGETAPRIFAIYNTLVLSVVPDGDGSHVIEFAEDRPNARSVKAELNMPVEGEMALSDAFDHLEQGNGGSICGSCHKQEQLAADIDYATAYESQALRPTPNDAISMWDIQDQAEACDPNTTPERCAIYDAIFYRGDVLEGDFPRPLPTLYD